MIIEGKYGKAEVKTENIDQESISQIILMMNGPIVENKKVVIMPDVHKGTGCVIGYTAELSDKICPNLIGVDIGCGVLGAKLKGIKELSIDDKKRLDDFIKENIPSGRNIRGKAVSLNAGFIEEVKAINKRTGQNNEYVFGSIGTLGGGNHFIEIDKDDNGELYLLVHSGSRNFGLKVANYYQKKAVDFCNGNIEEFEARKKSLVNDLKKVHRANEIPKFLENLKESLKIKVSKGMEFFDKSSIYYNEYIEAMKIAQIFAQTNRHFILTTIMRHFFGQTVYTDAANGMFESVHNFIDFEDNIVRKGAIRSHVGEKLIIPLNMSDGCIVGTGKSNADWNMSAPHGAGRILSRSQAKSQLKIEDYEKVMSDKDVYSSCISYNTIDESPMAYKPAKEIIEAIKDTVNIEFVIKPVYNYKAQE